MKVLVYNWRDVEHPDAGGAEVFTHEVCQRLVERGHEVTLFTSAFDGCDDETTLDGVQIVRSGGRFTVYRAAKTQYRRRFRGAVDVVVDEINTRPFMTPSFVDEPVVALIHQLAREFWFYETPAPISWLGYYWLEDRWLARYTDVPTLTVSGSTKADLRGLGFEDVTVVPQGLSTDPLDSVPEKADEPTFAFLGRMVEAKRPTHALRAFEHVAEWLPEATLHMLGDGYLTDDLRERADDSVTVHGYVSAETKRRLLQRSHLLLVPGVREGWGLVVTEANAMGTPAIGYDVPGLRDSIVDRETGVLCEETPERMAEATYWAITNGVESLSENALEDARQYDWDRTTDAVEAQLRRVVAE